MVDNITPKAGLKLIFRWSRIEPRTGRRVYAHGRPFPMWVPDDGSGN